MNAIIITALNHADEIAAVALMVLGIVAAITYHEPTQENDNNETL